MKRREYYNAPWPNLSNVSLGLRMAHWDLHPKPFMALLRLFDAIAVQQVNSYLSGRRFDPSLEDCDERLATICRMQTRTFKALRKDLEPFFVISGGRWRLFDDDVVVISKPDTRRSLPTDTKTLARKRSRHVCVYCGDDSGPFHYDHLYPVSLGGSDDINNIVLACSSCNLSKGGKTLQQWMEAGRD